VGPLPADQVPRPGSCARKSIGTSGRAAPRCGHALSTPITSECRTDDRVVSAQQELLQLMGQGEVSAGIYADDPVTGNQFFADVAAIGGRVLRYASQTDLEDQLPASLHDRYRALAEAREGRRLSASDASAVTAAVEAVAALNVLTSSDAHAAGARLRWLVSGSRSRGKAVTATNIGWGRHVSDALRGAQLAALETFLGPTDQLRYRCGTSMPRLARHAPCRHRFVPALLWPHVADRFAVPGIGPEPLAAALASAVVVVGTPTSLAQAASLLGSATTAASASRALQALHSDRYWEGAREALTHIADAVDAGDCPIDYQRRRTLPFNEFLSNEEWHAICLDTATSVGRGVRLRLIRCWMYERLTGSPGDQYSESLNDSAFRAKLAAIGRWLRAGLVDRLESHALAFLNEHGCSGEPLFWTPPPQLIEDCALPRQFTAIDAENVHRLMENPLLSLSAIADRLALSLPIVRAILEAAPAETLLTEHQSRSRGMFARLKARLPSEEFEDLYVSQGQPLWQIAAYAGSSRQTLTKLAHYYGITLRPPGRAAHIR
jgi:hypothetical protein